MKILLANNVFYPYQRGGAEAVVASLAEAWSRAGHEVRLVALCPQQSQPNKDDLVYQKIYWSSGYYDLASKPIWRRFLWHLPDWLGLAHLFDWYKLLKSFKPDLVIINNLTGLGLAAHRLCRWFNIASVQIFHDVQYVLPSGLLLVGQEKILNNWSVRCYRRLTAWWLSPAKLLISPSEWLRDFYKDNKWLPSANWLILANPIDNQLALDYQLPNKLRQAVFVGQLTEAKGIGWLVEQWSDFNRTLLSIGLPEVDLKIIGDGPLLNQLKNDSRFDRRISVIGRIDKDKIIEQMKEADIIIVPSNCYENWPTVLLESARAGRLAIVVDHGGAGELAEKLSYLTFRAGDLDSFLMAWRQLSVAAAKLNVWPAGSDLNIITPNQYLSEIISKINNLAV